MQIKRNLLFFISVLSLSFLLNASAQTQSTEKHKQASPTEEAKQDQQTEPTSQRKKTISFGDPAPLYAEKLEGRGVQMFKAAQTTVHFIGRLALVGIYDIDSQNATGFVTNSIPLDKNFTVNGVTSNWSERQGHLRLVSNRASFTATSKTETPYGPIDAFVSGTFFIFNFLQPSSELLSNTADFRLFYAYTTWNNFTIGQTFSTFTDMTTFPERVTGQTRTGGGAPLMPQITYWWTSKTGNVRMGIGINNPEAEVSILTLANQQPGTFAPATLVKSSTDAFASNDHYPDLTGQIWYKHDWWHVSLSGVLRDLGVDNRIMIDRTPAIIPRTLVDKHKIGWGLKHSGRFGKAGSNNLLYTVRGGKGLGRYITFATGQTAVVLIDPTAAIPSASDIITRYVFGANITYQHWWSKKNTIRTNVFANGLWFYDNDVIPNNQPIGPGTGLGNNAPTLRDIFDEKQYAVGGNLIWSPFQALNLGVEYSYGFRKALSGASGDTHRISAAAHFYFINL